MPAAEYHKSTKEHKSVMNSICKAKFVKCKLILPPNEYKFYLERTTDKNTLSQLIAAKRMQDVEQ